LFSVRILNCDLFTTEATLIEGLMCVVGHRKSRNGTHAIISLAIAGKQTTLAINKVLQLALDNGIIIVAPSGNGHLFKSINYDSCLMYPAGYPGVINVGATDIDDNALMGEFDGRIYITNMGSCLDVFAPGYELLSSDLCSSTTSCYNRVCRSFRSGASQSSVIVAGAIALLLEKCIKLTYTEIKNILRHSLSVKKVMLYRKSLRFLNNNPNFIKTIVQTRNSLLHLNLTNVNCSIYV